MDEDHFPEEDAAAMGKLPREVAMVYDVALVCDGSGVLATSCSQQGLVTGPVLDHSVSGFYDLLEGRFF